MDALEKLEVVQAKTAVAEPLAPAPEPAPAPSAEPAPVEQPPLEASEEIDVKRAGTVVTRVELEPKHVASTVTRVELEPEPSEIATKSLPQDSLAPVVVAERGAPSSDPPPALEASSEEAKAEEPTPYVPEVAEKLAEAEAAPKKDGREETAKAETATEPTQKSAAVDLPEDADDATPPAVEFGAVEEFFEAGKHVAARAEPEETFEDLEKVKQKHLPHVVARRAKLARYVGWAVGIAGVVCLAAVARTAFSPSAAVATANAKTAVVVKPVEPALAAQPVEQPKAEEGKPEQAKAEEPRAEEPKADEAKAEEAKAEEAKPAEPAKTEEAKPVEAKPAEAKPNEATPTVTAAQTGDKTAREEKRASQQALERGKLADSVAAGERSVALDPGDAEAWLILGAAYQQKGDLTNMRRAFKSCLEQATRGPKGECAQFAH